MSAPGKHTLAHERDAAQRRLDALLAAASRLEAGDVVGAEQVGLELDGLLNRLDDVAVRIAASERAASVDVARRGIVVGIARPQHAGQSADAERVPRETSSRQQLSDARSKLGVLVRAASSLPAGCPEASAALRRGIAQALAEIGGLKPLRDDALRSLPNPRRRS